MATPTNELRLELQTTGSNSTTWGEVANVNFRLIEDAISGLEEIATTGGTTTLTTANGSSSYASSEDQARYAILKITGILTSDATIVVPAVSKVYHVWNATTGDYTVTFKVAGTGIAVTQGKRIVLICDGTEVYSSVNDTANFDVASTNTAESVDGELVLFSGTDGKTLKRADFTGMLKALVGVISAATENQDYLNPYMSINDQIGTTYTFVLTDAYNRYCRFSNAAAITATVPPNSSVAFPVGTQLHIRQVGIGQVTLAQGSGVVINTEDTLKLRGLNATATLIKVSTNVWDLMGSLEEL